MYNFWPGHSRGVGSDELKKKATTEQQLEQRLLQMSAAKVNDAVLLAFLSEEDVQQIRTLDLTALAEFKRGSNGVVELKFTDRTALTQSLLEQFREDPAQQLLRQLGGGDDG